MCIPSILPHPSSVDPLVVGEANPPEQTSSLPFFLLLQFTLILSSLHHTCEPIDFDPPRLRQLFPVDSSVLVSFRIAGVSEFLLSHRIEVFLVAVNLVNYVSTCA